MQEASEGTVGLCGPCIASKRPGTGEQPTIRKTEVPTAILQKLSMDLAGPIKTTTGHIYLIYVMDLLSRYLWIGTSKTKAPEHLFEFVMERVFSKTT